MTVEVRITLRLPRELHAKLRQAIKENRRSLNTEIVTRLERTVTEDAGSSDRLGDVERRLKTIEDALQGVALIGVEKD